MQFVETDVASGGSGITFVPHDPQSSVPPCPPVPVPGQRCVTPAFLETSHDIAELDLLRYYPDDGSSLHRPFLSKETVFPFNDEPGRDGLARNRGRPDAAPRVQGHARRRRHGLRGPSGARLLREPDPPVPRHR